MAEIAKETCEGNGVEVIVFNGKKYSIKALKFSSSHITIFSKV